jgi:cytochrome c oxidase accessory protein FixG
VSSEHEEWRNSAPIGAFASDGTRTALEPADVRGRFWRRRHLLFGVLIGVYLGAPLFQVGGHPAVHLDFINRRFYLLGTTFNAQDVWFLVFFLWMVGFGLLFLTAWLGRVWCGWACPQTVFLEGVFRNIERWVDGPRERRLRLSKEPWSASRVARLVLKHGLYLAVSMLLAHVALSLFASIPGAWTMIREGPSAHPVAFGWTVGSGLVIYGNFAWFREQLCLVICPYGRLQSALQDDHSLIIGYDARRGEQRGRFIKGAPRTAGDCVDCSRCVLVCPTGIDIRHGLQMECVGCARCIDACDEVMARVGMRQGLIRYDSMEGLEGRPRRVLRPRLYAYGLLLSLAVGALIVSLSLRKPFEANLLRPKGMPYVLDGATVRNQWDLHLVNKRSERGTFEVSVVAPSGVTAIIPQSTVKLESLESFDLPLFVSAPRELLHSPLEVEVVVRSVESGQSRHASARVIGPPGSSGRRPGS